MLVRLTEITEAYYSHSLLYYKQKMHMKQKPRVESGSEKVPNVVSKSPGLVYPSGFSVCYNTCTHYGQPKKFLTDRASSLYRQDGLNFCPND